MAAMTDLERRSPTGTICDRSPLGGDAIVDLRIGHHREYIVGAATVSPRADQGSPTTAGRQINQFVVIAMVQPHMAVAVLTWLPLNKSGDRNSEPAEPGVDADYANG